MDVSNPAIRHILLGGVAFGEFASQNYDDVRLNRHEWHGARVSSINR